DGRVGQALAHQVGVVGGAGGGRDPLGVGIGPVAQLRRAVAQEEAADIVEPLHGHRQARIPERLEVGGHVGDDRPAHQYVAVAEVVLGVPVVIVVLVVAPAGDGDQAV